MRGTRTVFSTLAGLAGSGAPVCAKTAHGMKIAKAVNTMQPAAIADKPAQTPMGRDLFACSDGGTVRNWTLRLHVREQSDAWIVYETQGLQG